MSGGGDGAEPWAVACGRVAAVAAGGGGGGGGGSGSSGSGGFTEKPVNDVFGQCSLQCQVDGIESRFRADNARRLRERREHGENDGGRVSIPDGNVESVVAIFGGRRRRRPVVLQEKFDDALVAVAVALAEHEVQWEPSTARGHCGRVGAVREKHLDAGVRVRMAIDHAAREVERDVTFVGALEGGEVVVVASDALCFLSSSSFY